MNPLTGETAAKCAAKDSVFTDLFSDRKNLLKLYRCLHPEDVTATEDSLELVTAKTVVTDCVYRDIGFLIHEKDNTSLILVEAQSTWSVNVIGRMFLYISRLYGQYLEKAEEANLAVSLPSNELYVIYPGERGDKPAELRLSRDLMAKGASHSSDTAAEVICAGEKGGILEEYITLCREMEEQISLYGMGLESVQETILTCRDKGILAEYLEAREEEVTKIMMDLYDRQQIAERYGESLARGVAEEASKKAEKDMVERMIRLGKFPLEDIAACAPSFSLDDLRKMEEASRHPS